MEFAQHLLTLYPKREVLRAIGKSIKIPFNWSPRDYQDSIWQYLCNGGKRGICIWNRRAGKDEICLHWAAKSAYEKPATYWHMLPEASQARKAIWLAVNPHTGKRRIDEAFPHEIREFTRENEMMIGIRGGGTWQVVGSDNFNSLVGSPPYGVVFSEWALANPEAWAYLRPILAENGGWGLFITTPRGENHAKNMYESALHRPDWFAEKLTIEDTNVLDEQARASELQEYIEDWGEELGTALYNQEWMCSFQAAIIGAYYAVELVSLEKSGRLTDVPFVPGIPVDTWWDLGYDDSTSIWFTQTVGREIHIIDYFENNNQGLIYYGKKLKELQGQNGWIYGSHTGPHDTLQHELGSGKDLKEQAANLKDEATSEDFSFMFSVADRISTQQQGIEAVRSILPLCWFDQSNTTKSHRERKVGFPSLQNYRNEWDQKHQTFKNAPLHDWACLHGSTRIRTLNGWVEIKDLIGKDDIYLWAYETEQKRLHPAKAEKCWLSKKTGRLLRVSLDHQQDIKCTPDHRFMRRDGSWVAAEDLKPGDSLMPFYENKDSGYARVHLTDGTIAEEHKFSFSVFNGYLKDGKHIHHIDSNKYNNNPSNLTQLSIREHISIHSSESERLRKLSANNRNGQPRNSDKATVHLIAYNKTRVGELHHSTNPEFWTKEIREKIGKKSHDLYKRSETIKVCSVCGEEFLGNWKRLYCCSACNSRARTIKNGGVIFWDSFKHSSDCRVIEGSKRVVEGNNHKVININEMFGDFEVYDISVPKYNCFVAEGVVVHNSHGSKALETMAISHQFRSVASTVKLKSAFG